MYIYAKQACLVWSLVSCIYSGQIIRKPTVFSDKNSDLYRVIRYLVRPVIVSTGEFSLLNIDIES